MKNKLFVGSLMVLLAGVGAGELRGQSSLVSYQGVVTDNGTNFTGVGLFKFALVTSTNANHQATANANMSGVSPNLFVGSCSVSFPGNGYTNAPAVTISGGGGMGATATATFNSGSVSVVNVLSPGSGYSSPPMVTIAPPPSAATYQTFWSNDGSSSAGSEPGNAVSVVVSNGLFTVVLGDASVANMLPFGPTVFNQLNLQLRVWFNDGVHGSSLLNPLQNLTAVPYAMALPNLRTQASQNGQYLSANVIAGYSANTIGANISGSVIAGGGSTVGFPQVINASYSSIGGGYSDTIGNNGPGSAIGGGVNNTVNSQFGFIGGGGGNSNTGYYGTIGGGNGNTVTAFEATVGGGGPGLTPGSTMGNTASGQGATVPGGFANTAGGTTSLAAGYRAKATNNGSFVWGDSTDADVISTANDQMTIRASGGIVLNTAGGGLALNASGPVMLNAGAMTLNASTGVGLAASAGSAAVNPGTLFKDNTIVAWGHVTGSTGVVTDAFNATATRNSAGNYTITLGVGLTGAHFMAVATPMYVLSQQQVTAATIRIASVNQQLSSTQFNVYMNSGTFAAADGDFSFIVMGR